MSMINSFLQKNKMHEAQHGIFMVAAAYVLSAALLFFGSDVFYGSRSKAEKINDNSYEATYGEPKEQYASVTNNAIVNPYGIAGSTVKKAEPVIQGSDDTNWLLGYAMSNEEYNAVLMNMAELEAYQATLLGAEEAPEEAVESFSVAPDSGKKALSLTGKEVAMLERIVEAEATGEDLVGRILVANVVLNRIADDEFPDTVEEVIFQRSGDEYQFSPISDKRYWSVEISDKTKEAVKKALEGEDYSEGALYFMARKRTKKSSARWFDDNLEWLFRHGGHEFYKNK